MASFAGYSAPRVHQENGIHTSPHFPEADFWPGLTPGLTSGLLVIRPESAISSSLTQMFQRGLPPSAGFSNSSHNLSDRISSWLSRRPLKRRCRSKSPALSLGADLTDEIFNVPEI